MIRALRCFCAMQIWVFAYLSVSGQTADFEQESDLGMIVANVVQRNNMNVIHARFSLRFAILMHE